MELEQPLNLIGKRVQQSRLSMKPRLTQMNLASKLQVEGLDIDQSQVSKIENGTRPVTDIEVAIIICINVGKGKSYNEKKVT